MPFDVILIIVILGILFGALLYFGKSAGISLIFSLPIAGFVYNIFPYTDNLLAYGKTPAESEWLKVALLVILIILSYLIIRRAVSVVFSWSSLGRATEATVLSLIITGLLVTYLASFINPDIVTEYFPVLKQLLTIPNILFWWFVGSMLALFFILNK